ncbi:MAG: phage baseplate assembly protein V [Caldimonas sp.]
MDDLVEDTLARVVERIGSTYYGKYRGIVADVADPENRCRIRATVPGLLDGEDTGWAMPVLPFAGDGHGMVMLPAVGSGVWIEFEAGHLDMPLWSGGWFANDQRPDPQGEKVRVIVSENGHRIVLDDAADEVRISHGSGAEIKLTGSGIELSFQACKVEISGTSISLNNGLIKVGLAGVSLVNGAMSLGVPP